MSIINYFSILELLSTYLPIMNYNQFTEAIFRPFIRKRQLSHNCQVRYISSGDRWVRNEFKMYYCRCTHTNHPSFSIMHKIKRSFYSHLLFLEKKNWCHNNSITAVRQWGISVCISVNKVFYMELQIPFWWWLEFSIFNHTFGVWVWMITRNGFFLYYVSCYRYK